MYKRTNGQMDVRKTLDLYFDKINFNVTAGLDNTIAETYKYKLMTIQ